jgi:hypothetical protein
MGRNTTTPLPQSLDRFSIGEIQDLSGVPDFYNAGSSKWLKSAVSTASSNLSTTTKTNLASAGTASDPTVLAQSALSFSYNTFGFYATYPIQRISASSISVVPANYTGTTAVGVGVMTPAGLQAVATGQTSVRTSSATTGTNAVVASNNTTIFSYCFSNTTDLTASSTTNGTTWTAGSVTGTPTFQVSSTTIAHASQASGASYTVASTAGFKRSFSSAGGQFAVFWCGARFLLLAPGTGANYYVASLSTDGLAWGGDNTAAVLGAGATALPIAQDIQFYRNGNNCFVMINAVMRFSTDGGVTWAACTGSGAGSLDPGQGFLQVNTSDPAKLLFINGTGSTAVYYSADSGASWSANRPIPFSNPNGGLYYKGSTAVVSNGSNQSFVSTNDGVTWTAITYPIGTLSANVKLFADANRFYAGVNAQTQILTSSDGVTWTLLTLSQQFALATLSSMYGYGIVSFDSNVVVLLGYNNQSGYNQAIFTLDGGVTWTASQYTVGGTGGNWGVGNAFVTPDAGGVGFAFGMAGVSSANNPNVLKTDILGGGAFYRTGVTAISPIRTNATSYVRVG